MSDLIDYITAWIFLIGIAAIFFTIREQLIINKREKKFQKLRDERLESLIDEAERIASKYNLIFDLSNINIKYNESAECDMFVLNSKFTKFLKDFISNTRFETGQLANWDDLPDDARDFYLSAIKYLNK